MKKTLVLIILFISSIAGIAQSNKIQKAFAYYSISMPGTQHVDLDGNKVPPVPITDRFIYIETNYQNKPMLDSVWYNSVLYTGTIEAITDHKHTVGVNALTGKPIIIIPKRGNRLWKLSLQQATSTGVAHDQLKKILLKCRLGNTIIKKIIINEIQLTTPERY